MASAHGPDTEGAVIRVCGYAIKNSGLIVEGTKEPSCLCEITPSQDPKSSGRRRVQRIVTSGRKIKARGDDTHHEE